jgi:purine-binding chemotaxis protein CheW
MQRIFARNMQNALELWTGFSMQASFASKRLLPLNDGPVAEYLAFSVAGETCALPLTQVREILIPPLLTRVPRAPENVMGIVSVRGILVTVLDLRRTFRTLHAPLPGGRPRILLVPAPFGEVMGLYVDEVAQVYRFAASEIETAASVLGGNVAEYILGIGRREEKTVLLLSLAPLLASIA